MTKLWKKSDSTLHPVIEEYTVGDDHILDEKLLPYDIVASIAHAKALEKAKVLSKKEVKNIVTALQKISAGFKNGTIQITKADEDCHTVIENELVKILGPVGKKIHAGRSRNDQVQTALRLYMKEKLSGIRKKTLMLAELVIEKASEYEEVPMPGYSHTQQAMLTTVGHYYASMAESLIDDAEFISSALKHIDKNPLGSAAGFGSSIAIDRNMTTKILGFSNVQLNSLYVQNSRGKFESIVVEALAQVMLTLSRFATDMLFFTAQETSYFEAPDSIVTGSSIMPHKRNLDCLEILRGNTSVVIAHQFAIKEITKNLLSGYNRDLQLIKKPLLESFDITEKSVEVATIVAQALKPSSAKIRAKIHPGIFMADMANELVKEKGIPFRDAYTLASKMEISTPDLKKNIATKKTLGAPGNLSLATLKTRLRKLL